MKIDVRPRKRNAPRPAEKSAPQFLQWIRGRSCLAHNHITPCWGKVEAAHVDYAGKGTSLAKGKGTKVADRFAVPLCTGHHGVQHSIGWPRFDREFLGFEGAGLSGAEQLWKAWPGRVKWEAKNG